MERRPGGIGPDEGPFGCHHDKLRDRELDVEFQLVEDPVVGFLDGLLAHRRRAVRRHEDSVIGVERQHRGGLAAVQRRIVGCQTLLMAASSAAMAVLLMAQEPAPAAGAGAR